MTADGGAARPLFLIGFMGSGKTSVGRALAAELGWEAVDIDALVQQREGRTIEQIFRESGEGHFRRVEWEALLCLEGRARCVVATGGGLFVGAAHRRWIRGQGRIVWLDVPLEICRGRVGEGAGRPVWDAGDPVALRALYEKRRAVYALADLRIAGPWGDPEETARVVLGKLASGFR